MRGSIFMEGWRREQLTLQFGEYSRGKSRCAAEQLPGFQEYTFLYCLSEDFNRNNVLLSLLS